MSSLLKLNSIKPLFDRVLVQRAKAASKTASGIYIPEKNQDKLAFGTVVANGPGTKNDKGELVPTIVKKDDKVLLPSFGGSPVKIDGEEYLLFSDKEILAKIDEFVKDSFTDSRESTIGAAFLTQTIQIDANTTVKFEIWDTAGQERYRSLASMYYRNAQAALVVYDITQESSLDKAKYWIKELQKQASSGIVIALVGNKLDLEEERKISKDEAQAFANELGLMYAEVSAKTGERVKDCFRDIALKLPLEEKLSQQGQRRRRTVDLNQRPSTNEQQCAC
ncbi:hypothetical protein KL920_001829 [Ogataea angusta]|nr:hypothetical protein KL920_001829 [Ogataea angusta]